MRENQILGAILFVLLGVAYFSWTKEAEKVTEKTVTVVQASPKEIEALRFITKTQTVSVSRREVGGETIVWFDIETKSRTRGFAGNAKTDKLIESFAPFDAIRSLGKVSEKEAVEAKLDHPKKKLVIKTGSVERAFDVGGRTYGSRDHYIRPVGGGEVFLIESKTIGDLEYPESRYMQRKLRKADDKAVLAVEIAAGGQTRRYLHQNHLSKKDAYWASEADAEKRSETAENYIRKLGTLSVRKYRDDADALKDATKIFELSWFGEGEKKLESMTLYKLPPEDEKKKPRYLAESTATRMPTEVTRSVGEQLESDLPVLFGAP